MVEELSFRGSHRSSLRSSKFLRRRFETQCVDVCVEEFLPV